MVELDRVRWQCRRGLLELDLVLSRFLERHWAELDEAQKAAFRRLLADPDNQLWDLLSGRTPAPDPESKKLIELFE